DRAAGRGVRRLRPAAAGTSGSPSGGFRADPAGAGVKRAAMIDAGLRERVLRALRDAGLVDVPGAPAAAVDLTPLGGGLRPRSVLAAVSGRRFVVRVSDDPRAGALELPVEASVTDEAAALGIAPPVVAADARGGALITEYLSRARPLTAEALAAPQNVVRLARLLKRLHSIRRPLRKYDPEALADAYTRGLGALGADDRRRAAELRELARAYAARYPSHVLCHNDLIASNVLDDGELKLVDFEYAVTAAPVLDLAGVAALNHFDDDGWQLANAYYGASPVPFTQRELRRVVRLVRLIAYFWALSSSLGAKDRGPYAAFAERAAAALDQTKRS